jgi:beta-phosphoglucomutase family hydrolase
VSRPIRAIVFDLNGTLVDDLEFHYVAWKALADRNGVAMTPELFQSWNGLKNEDLLPRFLGLPPEEVPRARIAELAREKEEHYRALYGPHVAPLAGAEAFLARLRAAGTKVALASSAPDENRSMVLERLGWSDAFDAIVLPTRLRSKPAPDIYLEAARRLGLAPAECAAFEDAENGVLAAHAAGMTVVGVTTTVPAEALVAAGASFTISDYTALPAELLQRLG